MMRDVVGLNAAISERKRDGQWRCVALPLHGIHEMGLSPDMIGFNADTSTLELDGLWQRAPI
eukprot:6278889-Karenia_brevis.AAC.1